MVTLFLLPVLPEAWKNKLSVLMIRFCADNVRLNTLESEEKSRTGFPSQDL